MIVNNFNTYMYTSIVELYDFSIKRYLDRTLLFTNKIKHWHENNIKNKTINS